MLEQKKEKKEYKNEKYEIKKRAKNESTIRYYKRKEKYIIAEHNINNKNKRNKQALGSVKIKW